VDVRTCSALLASTQLDSVLDDSNGQTCCMGFLGSNLNMETARGDTLPDQPRWYFLYRGSVHDRLDVGW